MTRRPGLAVYLLLGTLFGIVLTKSEAVSWFRIQEMFRFQSFHMYGIFMTAIPVAMLGVQWLKRSGMRTACGDAVAVPPKTLGTGARYVVGGTTFGLGWAITGACPGPLFALLGSGIAAVAIVIVAALAGTWIYGVVRPYLPH